MARMRSSETSSSIHITPSGCIIGVNGAGEVEIQHIEGTAEERRIEREQSYDRLEARKRPK